MTRIPFAAALLTAGLLIAPPSVSWAADMDTPYPEHAQKGEATPPKVEPPSGSVEELGPEALTKRNCSVCHSFKLVENQRLDRATWEWVMDDMVNEFGAAWITEKDQKRIIDYLVDHYGPEQ